MNMIKKLCCSLIAAIVLSQFSFAQDWRDVAKNYSFKTSITPSESTLTKLGKNTYANFPVLLRLPVEVSAALQTNDGTDLLIVDQNGAMLSYEIDTFNPEGTSLVWVKIPEFSSDTSLSVYSGGPKNSNNVEKDVWSDFVGAWHFNPATDFESIADVTGNGLDGVVLETPIAYEPGLYGLPTMKIAKSVKTPDYDSLVTDASKFSFSGWFKLPDQVNAYVTFISKKTGLTWNHANGWYLEMGQSKTKCNLVLTGTKSANIKDVSQNWNYFHVVSEGNKVNVYFNGSTDANISYDYTIKKSGLQSVISAPNGISREYRLRNRVLSAKETALEYATVADEAFFTYTETKIYDPSEQVLATPTYSINDDGSFCINVELLKNNGDVGVIYETSDTSITNIIAEAASPGEYTDAPTNLPADKTYKYYAYGKNAKGTEVVVQGDIFYNGEIIIEKLADAEENNLKKGTFRISRADTSFDLIVNISVAGDAVAGQTYESLPETITIPAGESFIDIDVTPRFDANIQENANVVVSIANGKYNINSAASSTSVTIVNLTTQAGYNTWLPNGGNLASDASNWSLGRAPISTDRVLFDGRYSNLDCEWDIAATPTVASWTQNNAFSGTITFATTFPEKGFEKFTITGDAIVDSGKWTHKENNTSENYRLSVSVGGNLAIGANAIIDARLKGYAKGQVPAGGAAGIHAGGQGTRTAVYGNVYEPTSLGAGNQHSAGGGAIYLVVGGDVVIDGTIRADVGENTNAWGTKVYGAAGSIYIKAKSVSGSGKINAAALVTDFTNTPGSGGRIAIILTEATELGMKVSNVKAEGSDGSGNGGAGAGTILIKTANQTYGTLYVRNLPRQGVYGHMYPSRAGTTLIPVDVNWTFDAIVFENHGILSVPKGTTLTLPNGFASISGNSLTSGLLYDGGAIVAKDKDDAVLQGKWVFYALTPYEFEGNVTLTNGAAIGCLRLKSTATDPYMCEVSVAGDMLVGKDSFLHADTTGIIDLASHERFRGYYSHGGQIGIYTNVVYGSILDPVLPGQPGMHNDSAGQYLGGGAIKLTVAGKLTLDGLAKATGDGSPNDYEGIGGGGSINITAGTLDGEGSISVIGKAPRKALSNKITSSSAAENKDLGVCTGGGRISVRLTDADAEFSDHWLASSSIMAYGGSKAATGDQTNALASAGTIYLQSGKQKEATGTIIVRNNNASATYATTPIPSTKYDNDEDISKASLVVTEAGRVMIAEDVRLNEVTVAEGSTINLFGNNMKVTNIKLGNKSLMCGTYTAQDLLDAGYVNIVDSIGGGTIQVSGSGLVIFVR